MDLSREKCAYKVEVSEVDVQGRPGGSVRSTQTRQSIGEVAKDIDNKKAPAEVGGGLGRRDVYATRRSGSAKIRDLPPGIEAV
ncbi:hypothetical protein R1sor_008824 [Riccia sorocarpa]|uniref:Uncharacterized protein n=1 Tax=Riccia sorocarpa TaxID=122646 RepID=A0ABD3HUP8_9MARC